MNANLHPKLSARAADLLHLVRHQRDVEAALWSIRTEDPAKLEPTLSMTAAELARAALATGAIENDELVARAARAGCLKQLSEARKALGLITYTDEAGRRMVAFPLPTPAAVVQAVANLRAVFGPGVELADTRLLA